jgi:magnesium chelatase subunit D
MSTFLPWASAETAVTLLAVDPQGLGGLWLRARTGPVRDRLVAALATLPLPLRRIHPGIADEALFGGIDLSASLAAGRAVLAQGLLAQAPALLLTMAERAPAGLGTRLGQWLDGGAGPVIAMDEGAGDEGPPAALTERLALFLDLDGIAPSHSRAVPWDADRLAAARERLPFVAMPKDVLAQLVRLAAELGIASLRAPLFTLAAARASAAFRGALSVTADDLALAAGLTLAHRALVLPDTAPPPDDSPPQDQTEGSEDRNPGAATIPDDILLAAVKAALPPDTLARLAAARAARGARGSGSGDAHRGNRRGRPLPARPGTPDGRARIDPVATLRAAAPWQTIRRAATGRSGLQIRPADIRLRRFEERSDRLLIFAVDASGSSALARLAEAKGAVELLLAEAYARRDHVALVAFRGRGAELLLPPTRSLVQAKRRLAGLPGGGATPLAHGLAAALDLARHARGRGLTPTLALLTDGRGNIALDGSANRAQAADDAARTARALAAAGVPGVVIDTASRPQPELRTLAGTLAALYLALPRADSRRLAGALAGALDAA